MPDLAALRERMVEEQLRGRGIADRRLLDAFRAVPRELFVPEAERDFAYADGPLPIAAGQTISQPYIVALMIEAARVRPGARVLEIGAGSGYAAAVLSRIADQVVAVERHAELAAAARERLAALGYGNVRVVAADGSAGLPDEGPFEAILAAASGRHVPQALVDQLAVGGILVMPLGEPDTVQTLVKVTRTSETDTEREDLGPVRFVPLIGEEGWREPAGADPLPALIAAAAEPLPDLASAAFGAVFDRFGDARVVLLGEASHGTSEFYRARAAITRRLIEEHGFSIVAVEADWPDAATIDRYVRHRARREGEDAAFERFPTWMWRNEEVDAFIRWLRRRNEGRAYEAMAGFYGLDLYNLGGSIRAVLDFLAEADPEAAKLAKRRYACLAPWSRDPAAYGRLAISEGYGRCEAGAVQMLKALLDRRMDCLGEECDEWLDAAANARLIANAERYYRVMYEGAAESWNLRDTHMFETLCQILDAKGPGAKAVVWAHNSHVGNARFTEMGEVREEVNIGQLAKQKFGEQARLIGFGTHTGTVAAADDWDEPMAVKQVRPSLPDSYERMCHDAGVPRFLLDLRQERIPAELEQALMRPRLERFIGVIYRPETERWSHYAEATLPRQFDAWVWFDETEAVRPLAGEQRPGDDATYPFGL
ncbi:MAG: protein-L-isoaspartate(D-aspartate) O-methyltransferase [Alphaproteobacteria bacterium]|nr:protein-L-isoaspartate(D-aspartate) O-methyltransferase [Alphaproteobacteria bacterium]